MVVVNSLKIELQGFSQVSVRANNYKNKKQFYKDPIGLGFQRTFIAQEDLSWPGDNFAADAASLIFIPKGSVVKLVTCQVAKDHQIFGREADEYIGLWIKQA